MSEMRHRQQLRVGFGSHEEGLETFIKALLESILPIPEQLRHVLRFDDDEVMRHAVSVISYLNLNELIPDLIHVYGVTQLLKHAIIEALGDIEDDLSSQFLVSILQSSEENIQLRIAAVYALDRGIRPDIGVPLLTIALDAEESADLRRWTISTLANFSRRSYLPQILSLLQDEEAIVRYEALYMVGLAGDASLISYIEPLLADTTPVNGRQTIAERAYKILKAWGVIS